MRIQISFDQWLIGLSVMLSVGLILLPLLSSRKMQGPGWRQQALLFLVALGLPVLIVWLALTLTAERMVPLAVATGAWAAGMASLLRQLRMAQSTLAKAQRNAAATLDAIADAVVNVSPLGEIRALNPVAQQLIPAGRNAHGRNIAIALDLDIASSAQLQGLIDRCLSERRIVRDENLLNLGDKRLRLTAGPIFDRDRSISEIVLALTDVSEAVAATERLYYEATHDALTGLPNRTLMLKQLADVVSVAMQHEQMAAVLFIDLDHFNRINDSLGHHVGDAILTETAKRLRGFASATNLVARWGGDEYVVVLTRPHGQEDVTRVADAIVRAAAQPIHVDNLVLHMTASVGVSITPANSINVTELLAMADTAMAKVKLEGNGGYRFFSNSMSLWNRNHIDIETNLRHALQQNEFELVYQPQMDVAKDELIGAEALLRWNRQGQGQVPPDEFVPVAEEVGLIIDIGIWVIYRVAHQLRTWADAGLKVVPVAVNVSARQCLDHRVAQVIADAIERTRINPAWLKIELTETTAMNNVDQVASLLRSIDAVGVGISVDDFGTGYSSLSFLKRFPISQLKIDRSFVNDITHDADDAAIVAGTIALAHGLGIQVVAEGVETEEQLKFLAARGCDAAQGYYFSRPVTVDVMTQHLAAPERLVPQQLPPFQHREIA